jgi:hypothetical protein
MPISGACFRPLAATVPGRVRLPDKKIRLPDFGLNFEPDFGLNFEPDFGAEFRAGFRG